ncbi:hypothetical protein J1605_002498 [Eschrichtius robustus]|uniref:Uncharacterized protein n=1 Tax=Eschrichtius robustus TaxID=9764 RepID=A0AB34HVN2_ESCRO|nr:hypothetical protein J1605_002498 [Eschrichtius robustus]
MARAMRPQQRPWWTGWFGKAA